MRVATDLVFRPVTIVLESQKEVDELYAVLNCGHRGLSEALCALGSQWAKLRPFRSAEAERLTQRVTELFYPRV